MMIKLERALFVIAFTSLGYCAIATLEAKLVEHGARRAVDRAIANIEAVETALPAEPAAQVVGTTLIGLLEVPRLGLSAPVVEGDDERTLASVAGHLPDTPRPWEMGNSAIAAHRDGLFRPLRHVRPGDAIVLRTPRGVLNYTVQRTRIVAPNDLSVLEPTSPHMLTLVTCFPFNYVGSAPQRFIVHAQRVTP